MTRLQRAGSLQAAGGSGVCGVGLRGAVFVADTWPVGWMLIAGMDLRVEPVRRRECGQEFVERAALGLAQGSEHGLLVSLGRRPQLPQGGLAVLGERELLDAPVGHAAGPGDQAAEYPFATRIAAWLQVGSAVPLLIAAATFFARLQRLGIRVPGPVIALVGGVLASTMVMFSGLVGWVLSRPEVTGDATLVHALNFLSFITGSVGFVLGIGLLVAGVAVPALVRRLVPRWLAWAGLVIAFCAELSFVAMVLEPLQFLFPIGRFLGLGWLVTAGFLLPRIRAVAGQTRADTAL